ncbi:LysR family transcriptional regulator [Arthrobacter sp. ISL-5]|uniref:LysR family transcriptional regulator n=1 Tax=Arthrobacter sp. ISL-5 TaxID=2819111 RepID=UPI001BE98547|nr:LysR family transcriptional regulator [Arthrobacter sp. ISL-5]MBT2555245.1 LysR family transcriptional regulator [Arthrobacter sp. ISL-5]
MLDLHRLTLLREVKLRGSMSAAARELSYSHSAISQQLGLLEKETGVVLLEKVGRNVKLTAAGEELVRNTEAILAAMERAEADLAASHERPQGVVTVAAFTTIGRSVLPTALIELAENFPGLDVRLRREDPEAAVMQLISRQVDAVITDAFPGTPGAPNGGIHTTVIGQDPIRGYLPRGVVFTDFTDLRNVRWVIEPTTSASSQWALRVCRERGIEPFIAHVSSDLLFHLRMVEQGLAAAFLPDMVLREAGSTISPSPWLPTDQQRSIQYLVRSGSEHSAALVAVRQAVIQALIDM